MANLPTGNGKNRHEDIDSKIADFMADIDEIVSGKKPSHPHSDSSSDWQQCFDETTQTVYYWNCKTNTSSWQPPSPTTKFEQLTNTSGMTTSKRRSSPAPPPTTTDDKTTKKKKKPTLIAEYTSSESEDNDEEEENTVDDIDELLNEVLDEKEKVNPKLLSVDLYPLFEADCRAAIARLTDLGDKSIEICTLRIQLETRLEDCLAGHLTKSYAVCKLEEALIRIEELEKLHLTSTLSSSTFESTKPSITISDMALLLSLPPPPPPPLSPPPITNEDDQTLQQFYAQLNGNTSDAMSSTVEIDKSNMGTKSESHHHHHHKDKKTKPAKTLPTGLIQKWAHARQELRGNLVDPDDS